MPARGRPPKASSPVGSAPSSDRVASTDPTVTADRQIQTEVSEPASSQNGGEINKPKRVTSPRVTSTDVNKNSNVGAKRPVRSTRNANPAYVDALTTHFTGPPPVTAFKQSHMWTASPVDLQIINNSINRIRGEKS